SIARKTQIAMCWHNSELTLNFFSFCCTNQPSLLMFTSQSASVLFWGVAAVGRPQPLPTPPVIPSSLPMITPDDTSVKPSLTTPSLPIGTMHAGG
ncbi:MAG TPA: hypothetical protein P5055_11325, partial [Candidatus Paceibacterota bacterium]|nr:hypothetical protein [Candidatus Paceibacterota bacterium]